MKKILDKLSDKLLALSIYYDDEKNNEKLAFMFGKVACRLSFITHPYK